MSKFHSIEFDEYIEHLGDVIRFLNGIDNVRKWFRLLDFIRSVACEGCYYRNIRLNETPLQVYVDLFNDLIRLGITFPKDFPSALDFGDDFEDRDGLIELIRENVYGDLFFRFFYTLGQLNSFKIEFINSIVEELDDNQGFENACECSLEIDRQLVSLSLIKLDFDEEFAPNITKFRISVIRNIKENLYYLKYLSMKARIPLKNELMKLISCDSVSINEMVSNYDTFDKYYGPMDYYVKLLIEKVGYLEDLVEGLNKKLDKLSKE